MRRLKSVTRHSTDRRCRRALPYVKRALLGDFWPERVPFQPAPLEPDIVIYPEPVESWAQKLRRKLWLRDPYCVWCGFLYLDPHHATIEHLVPRAYGGRNSMENCRLACASCNRKRGSWYERALYLIERRRARWS